MAAVRIIDSFPFETFRQELKAYIGIDVNDTDQEARLRVWWDTAVRQADLWVDDTFDPEPPPEIKLGLFEFVKTLWARLGSIAGVTSVKTGQLAETYAMNGVTAKMAFLAAKAFWRPVKRNLLVA